MYFGKKKVNGEESSGFKKEGQTNKSVKYKVNLYVLFVNFQRVQLPSHMQTTFS